MTSELIAVERDGYGRHTIFDAMTGSRILSVKPTGLVEVEPLAASSPDWLAVYIEALQVAQKIADRPEPWQPYDEQPAELLYTVSFQAVDPHYAASVEQLEGRGVWPHLWDKLTWHTVSHETTDPWDQVETLHNWEQTREQPIRNVSLMVRVGEPSWKPLRLTCPQCLVYLYPTPPSDGRPLLPVHRCANCGQSC